MQQLRTVQTSIHTYIEINHILQRQLTYDD